MQNQLIEKLPSLLNVTLKTIVRCSDDSALIGAACAELTKRANSGDTEAKRICEGTADPESETT